MMVLSVFFAFVNKFPTYFVAVYVIGFIAAVTIGSIAWYNSSRPAGWENTKTPTIVPKVDLKKQPTKSDIE